MVSLASAKSSAGGKPGTSSAVAPSKTGTRAYGACGQANAANAPGKVVVGPELELVVASLSVGCVLGTVALGIVVVFGTVVLGIVALGSSDWESTELVEPVSSSDSDVAGEAPGVTVVLAEPGGVSAVVEFSPLLAAGGVHAVSPIAT